MFEEMKAIALRIATALEAILVRLENPVRVSPCTNEKVIKEELIHVGPENAGEFQQPGGEAAHTGGAFEPVIQQPEPPGVWDPITAEVQGSIRAKDKQAAITATLVRLGITPPKSWSWAKKHQAIHAHVAQNGAAALPAVMTWADFEAAVKAYAAAGHRDLVIDVTTRVEGQPTIIAESTVTASNYKLIIDTTNVEIAKLAAGTTGAEQTGVADTNIVTHSVDPATLTVNKQTPATPGQPADFVPGTPVNTPDELSAYGRYLMANNVTIVQINAAIPHIAPGITLVPADRVNEAFNAIAIATGIG